MIPYLPHANATLNGLAILLLLLGLFQIKRGNVAAHKRTMLTCFGVSVVFLICYLTYHYHVGSKRFPTYAPDMIRYVYLSILLTHVVLAAFVPFLALITIFHGLRDHRPTHRAWARWTYPIWLYVSITGVIVYAMLYHMYPPRADATTIAVSGQPPTSMNPATLMAQELKP